MKEPVNLDTWDYLGMGTFQLSNHTSNLLFVQSESQEKDKEK